MRQAIAAGDMATLRELSSPANLPGLEPGSIFVISAELWVDPSPQSEPEVFRILDQARRLYPGDFVLQAAAGYYYQSGFRFETALACRTAALSLRPGDITTRTRVAESQYYLGHLTAALATLRDCIAADPANVDANDLMGVTQLRLGDRAGALASLSRSPQFATDPFFAPDLHVAQFYNGVLTREEFEGKIDNTITAPSLGVYLYALLDHPDPAQRDPQFVLRTLADRALNLGDARWPKAAEMVARVRLADWDGARAVLEGPFKPPYLMLMTPMCYDFIGALIYAHLGRQGEAQQCYKRGLLAWEAQIPEDAAGWEQSDALRWRREAEAVLAR
jgi:tetratricopeptide (TPR) repeat protein